MASSPVYKFKNKTKYWAYEDQAKKLLHFLSENEMLHPGVTKATIAILEDASIMIEQSYETVDPKEAAMIRSKTHAAIMQGKDLAEAIDKETTAAIPQDEIHKKLKFGSGR